MPPAVSPIVETPWSSADIYSPDGSKILVRKIKDALQQAGLPHLPKNGDAPSSVLNRGCLTGLTSAQGATGFSVRPDRDALFFNVVVTGSEAGVDFEPMEKVRSGKVVTLTRPINAEILCPRIADVFEDMSFGVREVQEAPVQLMQDQDIDYVVTTDHLPRDEQQEHSLITEMVDLASYETQGSGGGPAMDKLRQAHAIYFALRSVPPSVLAEHLDASRVNRLVRRSQKYGAPGEHEHWLVVQSAQRG